VTLNWLFISFAYSLIPIKMPQTLICLPTLRLLLIELLFEFTVFSAKKYEGRVSICPTLNILVGLKLSISNLVYWMPLQGIKRVKLPI
jgi:hypothetical protein